MRIERYAYDRAGRLVKEGDRTYRYGYLDKVLSVTGGGKSFTYSYHADGQLARAEYGGGRSEDFLWDGLALVRRGDEQFVNEPHLGGGNPVASSKGVAYLNDMLGTTVGTWGGRAAQKRKEKRRYSAAALTAFGEPLPGAEGGAAVPSPFFTGKPDVPGLGRVFLFRNYRPGLAKWQTADPLGYPDGWNALAYCGNEVIGFIDFAGACKTCPNCGGTCPCLTPHYYYPEWFHGNNTDNLYCLGRDGFPVLNPDHPFANAIEDYFPNAHYFAVVHDSWVDALNRQGYWDSMINIPSMPFAYLYGFGANAYSSFLDFLGFAQNSLGLDIVDIDRLKIDPIVLYQCSCKE